MGIFRISQPVVDLCSKPDVEFPSDYSHQEYRETQLLYGEAVSILDSERGWLKIGALEQPVFDKHVGWRPYIGWIKDSQVKAQVKAQVKKSLSLSPSHVVIRSEQFSFGTWIGTQQAGARLLPTKPCRHTLVADAHLFLGAPYLWGGRSFYSQSISSVVSSVDCSGLINLLYRAQGIILPRNCYDQYLKGDPTPTLLPGDPLYLAKEERPHHVILKISDTQFIEAPETGKQIRLLTWGDDIWQEGGRIHIFDRSYLSYPRTFIS